MRVVPKKFLKKKIYIAPLFSLKDVISELKSAGKASTLDLTGLLAVEPYNFSSSITRKGRGNAGYGRPGECGLSFLYSEKELRDLITEEYGIVQVELFNYAVVIEYSDGSGEIVLGLNLIFDKEIKSNILDSHNFLSKINFSSESCIIFDY